jgi:hypothetical protein
MWGTRRHQSDANLPPKALALSNFERKKADEKGRQDNREPYLARRDPSESALDQEQ